MKSHYLIKLSFDLTHCKSLYLLSEITTDIYQCALRSQSVLSTDIISKQPPLLLTCDKPQCALCAGFVRCLQPVLVSRQDPDSRKNTIQEIDSRAKSGGHWPQVRHNTGKKNILHAKKIGADVYCSSREGFQLITSVSGCWHGFTVSFVRFRRPRSFNCVSFFQSILFQKHTRIACCR